MELLFFLILEDSAVFIVSLLLQDCYVMCRIVLWNPPQLSLTGC